MFSSGINCVHVEFWNPDGIIRIVSLVPEKLYSLGVGTDKIASGLYAASGITGVSMSQGI